MEEILKQIDKEIEQCNEACDTLTNIMKTATGLDETFRIGRLLSESHGEHKGLMKAKSLILNSAK